LSTDRTIGRRLGAIVVAKPLLEDASQRHDALLAPFTTDAEVASRQEVAHSEVDDFGH